MPEVRNFSPSGDLHLKQNNGARPKQVYFNRQQTPSNNQRTNYLPKDGQNRGENKKEPRRQFPLNFHSLKKMLDDDTEPQNVAQKFSEANTGLKNCLKDNTANWEIIELVLAVIGRFCQKGGVAQFHSAFTNIVKTLSEMQVFQNIESVILSIPKSRATNLGSPKDRLHRLIESINHMTTEMLTVMPAFACDALGPSFFEDIIGCKNIPKIREIMTLDLFDTFGEVTVRLKVFLIT